MFKDLLHKLAYPLFAKEVEAYYRLNNAILGINRWCASDYKANVISTHLLQVRDDLVTHSDHSFRERLRALDKPAVTVTSVSVPESRPLTSDRKPYSRPDGTPVASDRKPYSRPDGTPVASDRKPYTRPDGTPVTSDRKPYTRPDGTPVASDRKPYTRPDGTPVASCDAAHQDNMAADAEDNFRKDCDSTPHEAVWSGSDDSCSSSSSSSSGD